MQDYYKRGGEAARRLGEQSSDYCRRLVENLVLETTAQIARLKALSQKVQDELDKLDSWLAAGPGETPVQVVRHDFWMGILLLVAALVVWAAEALLVVWTFDPFQEIGMKKYLISAGIAFISLSALERILNYLSQLVPPRALRILCLFLAVGAGITGLVALIDLALVRGFLLKALIQTRMVSGDTGPAEFYGRSGALLTFMFASMAVAFALGGALLMREATERLGATMPILQVYKRRQRLDAAKTVHESRIKELEGLPRECENDFTMGAMDALAEARKSEENRETEKSRRLGIGLGVFVAVLVLVIVLASRVFAGELVVVGLDLSLSELAVDHQGETEFSKNLAAVGERIVPNIGPASDLYVLGITGNSLGLPYYILRGRTGPEPGYFGEVLKADIQRIRGDWEKVSRSLKPTEKATDIFGFLNLAELTFRSFPSHKKTLVLFSDMRHCTSTIDLESPARLDPQLLQKVRTGIHVPDLKEANIYVYGVHCFHKTALYHEDLRKFWTDFLALTKGGLKTYSNLREVAIESAGLEH